MTTENEEGLESEWEALRTCPRPKVEPVVDDSLERSWFQRYGVPEEAWYVYTGYVDSFTDVLVLRVRLLRPYKFSEYLTGWCVKTLASYVLNQRSSPVSYEWKEVTKVRKDSLLFTFEDLEKELVRRREKHIAWGQARISGIRADIAAYERELKFYEQDTKAAQEWDASEIDIFRDPKGD